jgi:hypothetical protein
MAHHEDGATAGQFLLQSTAIAITRHVDGVSRFNNLNAILFDTFVKLGCKYYSKSVISVLDLIIHLDGKYFRSIII